MPRGAQYSAVQTSGSDSAECRVQSAVQSAGAIRTIRQCLKAFNHRRKDAANRMRSVGTPSRSCFAPLCVGSHAQPQQPWLEDDCLSCVIPLCLLLMLMLLMLMLMLLVLVLVLMLMGLDVRIAPRAAADGIAWIG